MKVFLLLVLSLSLLETKGQTSNMGCLGFSGIIDVPSPGFHKHGYKSGKGISVEYYSKDLIFNKSKTLGLRLGGSFFLARQNSISNNVHLHKPYDAPGKQVLTNNHSSLDFHTLLIYERGTIRPYAAVFVGCGFFTSGQNLTLNEPIDGYETKTQTSQTTASMDYGFSSGVLIQIAKLTFLNFKGSAYYFTNNIQFNNLSKVGYDGLMKVPDYISVMPLMCSLQVGFVFKLAPGSTTYHRGTSHYYGYHGGGGFHGGGIPLR